MLRREGLFLYKGKNLRISQCMIVKDEEKNIEKALSWGKGILWEQIVVDTGSTDRTVEIARQMGAKVFHFTWIDDFSAAKNYAIEQAKGDWIAFLDADEYFPHEDRQKLVQLLGILQNHQCDGVMTRWIHLNDQGNIKSIDSQIRFFRNDPCLRYQKRIHEHLTAADGHDLRIWDGTDNLSIYHLGYTTEAFQTKKGRNRKLILEELADHPEDYEMLGYLGNEYEVTGEWELAEESYRKAVSHMPEKMQGIYDITTSGCMFRLLELLSVKQGVREEELLDFYRQAVEGWPEEGDYDYVLGDYYASLGNYPSGQQYLAQALKKLEQYGNSARSAKLSGRIETAYQMLATCCYHNGDLAECVRLSSALLREKPYDMKVLVLLLSALHQDMDANGRGQEGAMEAAAFLGKNFYNLQGLKERLFLLRGAMEAGYGELAQGIRGLFSPEELRLVDQAMGQKPQ